MIYLPELSAGVDKYITQLQNILYPFVRNKWGEPNVGLTEAQYDCWPRAYDTWRGDGYVPQIVGAIAQNVGEYQQALPSDKVLVRSFFQLVDPVIRHDRYFDFTVSLYFFISDLTLVRQDYTKQRADELVIQDICNFIDANKWFGFVTKKVYRRNDEIFSRYSGSMKKEGVKKWNIQPSCCFRIDMTNSNNLDLCDTLYSPINGNVFSEAFSDVFA